MIDQEEIICEMADFICEMSLWEKFKDRLRSKGYSEEEIQDIEDG